MTDIIVEPPPDGAIIDPMSWFDSPGPFELEIGCGKGGFLLSRARANPRIRMLGIEWTAKYFRFAADRMARWGLSNVRVMRTDAKPFFMNQLRAGSVCALHLYHPDPWPKKRHHKRRMVQADFVDSAARVLAPEGAWLIQSDHEEYFAEMTALLDGHEALERLAWETTGVDPGEGWSGTNFEIKYAREGRPIYRAAYRKRP